MDDDEFVGEAGRGDTSHPDSRFNGKGAVIAFERRDNGQYGRYNTSDWAWKQILGRCRYNTLYPLILFQIKRPGQIHKFHLAGSFDFNLVHKNLLISTFPLPRAP
ncbi:MAG: hypothetical protein R6U27_15710 [Desulfobacterales bacterium]